MDRASFLRIYKNSLRGFSVLTLLSFLYPAFQARAESQNSGMLVYSDNNSTDSMRYKIFNSSGTHNFTTASSCADVDAGSANKVPITMFLYSSRSRNEKVLLSEHWINATSMLYIYGQVWNGNSQTWGNVQLLDSFDFNALGGNANLRGHMSGTYLINGDFMALHVDGISHNVHYSIWNGSSWSTVAGTTPNIGTSQDPGLVVAAARPGTNEVLAVVVATDTTNAATFSYYYNGQGYSSVNWSSAAISGADNTRNLRVHTSLVWSRKSPTRCALVYSGDATNRWPYFNIFTANGSGGGNWGTADTDGPPLSDRPGDAIVVERPGTDEFLIGIQDNIASNSVRALVSYEERDGDTTPTLQTLTNSTMTINGEDNTLTYPFGMAYEQQNNALALMVYADTMTTNGTIPQLKKYSPATRTWDAAGTNLTTLAGNVENVDVIPDPLSNDMIILLRTGDRTASTRDFYTVFWDGNNDIEYAAGDRAMSLQAASNGFFSTNHAASFAWDEHKRGNFFNMFE